MTTSASHHFNSYRAEFGLRSPDLSRSKYADETDDLTSADDVYSLLDAPMSPISIGTPSIQQYTSGDQMYLWLIAQSDVYLAIERGNSGLKTERKRLAHTNLSGGNAAHAGGELWFKDDSSIWITGGSSRYAPKTPGELSRIKEAFEAAGYSVQSCGWDEDLDAPARFFRNIN